MKYYTLVLGGVHPNDSGSLDQETTCVLFLTLLPFSKWSNVCWRKYHRDVFSRNTRLRLSIWDSMCLFSKMLWHCSCLQQSDLSAVSPPFSPGQGSHTACVCAQAPGCRQKSKLDIHIFKGQRSACRQLRPSGISHREHRMERSKERERGNFHLPQSNDLLGQRSFCWRISLVWAPTEQVSTKKYSNLLLREKY